LRGLVSSGGTRRAAIGGRLWQQQNPRLRRSQKSDSPNLDRFQNATNHSGHRGSGWLERLLENRMALRIAQAEYVYSEFLNGSATGHKQNNLRLSAGVIFNFGKT
jgi:hypothetical protein